MPPTASAMGVLTRNATALHSATIAVLRASHSKSTMLSAASLSTYPAGRAGSGLGPAASAATAADFEPAIQRSVKDVVVVGAGVAGLATAACLARIGLRVTIADAQCFRQQNEDGPSAAGVGEGETGREAAAAAGKPKNDKSGGLRESNGREPEAVGRGVGPVVDPGVGIWTHGLECLESLGVLRQLEAEGRYMGDAGYRDRDGNWLAAPSRPLEVYASQDRPPPAARGAILEGGSESDDPGDDDGGGGSAGRGSGACVLFVRESKLIEALRSAIPDDTKFVRAEVDYIAERGVDDDVFSGGGGDGGPAAARGTVAGRLFSSEAREESDAAAAAATGTDASSQGGRDGAAAMAAAPRWKEEFDLLVGADGPQSFVRSRATLLSVDPSAAKEAGSRGASHGDSATKTRAAAADAASPERRGYAVYRGVCSRQPVARAAGGGGGRGGGGGEDEEGEDWGHESFQTWGPGLRFASVPLAGGERMWFATVADEILIKKGGGGSCSSVTLDKERQAASSSSEETKLFLLSLFEGWHAPIASLLRATQESGIVGEDAEAMSRRALKAAGSALAGARRRPGLEGLVLVGDAAHTLDPVLAQGAGVALEDAFFLAQHIKDFNASASSAAAKGEQRGPASENKGREGQTGEGLEQTLERYDSERLQRALLLSGLSDISQALGQLRPGWLVRVRDSSLTRFIPAALRSRVFDGLMASSLAGGFAGGMAAAASAALGGDRGERWRFGGYRVPRL